jgi:N-acetylmuramic acid 6-phosphate etherase
LSIINAEDRKVIEAVAAEMEAITAAVEAIYARMKEGGRLIYIGAGTSGRLGVVDASEMPPTYSVPHGVVIGLMAGGERAMFRAVEGAEDKPEWGREDIAQLNVGALDSVVGIAASGRTPYVIGGLQEANERGALTVGFACTRPAGVLDAAQLQIAVLTGPEVVEGSTRMKAGTATKLVLNMISTTLMIRLGKTYGNLMVDLQPTNQKLRATGAADCGTGHGSRAERGAGTARPGRRRENSDCGASRKGERGGGAGEVEGSGGVGEEGVED